MHTDMLRVLEVIAVAEQLKVIPPRVRKCFWLLAELLLAVVEGMLGS